MSASPIEYAPPSLEHLLPLSLWPDSFMHHRAAALEPPQWSLLAQYRRRRRAKCEEETAQSSPNTEEVHEESDTAAVWTVLAAVLCHVRGRHLVCCPLCAPRRPTRWWTPNKTAESVTHLPIHAPGCAETVLEEAEAFLRHVYARRAWLEATRPIMYANDASGEALTRECAAIGGIALLEALLIGVK